MIDRRNSCNNMMVRPELLPSKSLYVAKRFSQLDCKPDQNLQIRRINSRFAELQTSRPATQQSKAGAIALKEMQEFNIFGFRKPKKIDFIATKTIKRKMLTNAFFQENKELFENILDLEASIFLCDTLRAETFYRNETIYESDQQTNGKIYLIYRGEVEQFNPSKSEGITNDTVSSSSSLKTDEESKMDENPCFDTPLSRTLGSDEYFGTEVLAGKKKREHTIVAKSQVKLLVVRLEDLEYAKYRYDKKRTQKFNLLVETLSLTSAEPKRKNQLFNNLKEKTLSFGEIFMSEAEACNFVYFLCKGKCEVQKKSKEVLAAGINSPRAKVNFRRNITVGVVEEGNFVGEEILFGKSLKYDYSMRVATVKAEFYVMETSAFLKVFEKTTVAQIKERYTQKAEKYQAAFDNISQEFRKMNDEAPLTPNCKKNENIFPELRTNWNPMIELPDQQVKASPKQRFSIQMKSEQDQSPQIDPYLLKKRNSVKAFCHQALTPRQDGAEKEISFNIQLKCYEACSTPRVIKTDDKNIIESNKFPDCFRRKSCLTTEMDDYSDTPFVNNKKIMMQCEDKSPSQRIMSPLDFGETRKKPRFYKNSKEGPVNPLKIDNIKRADIFETDRQEINSERSQIQFQNTSQLFLEKYFKKFQRGARKMWPVYLNEKYDPEKKIFELKEMKKRFKQN